MPRVVPILLGLSVAGFTGQGMAGSGSGGAQKRGNIMVEPPRQRGTFLAAGIAAAFAEELVPGSPDCQTTVHEIAAEVGSCTVKQWTTPTTGRYTFPVSAPASAGTITLVGDQKSALLVPEVKPLAKGGSSVRYALSPDSMHFAPGDALTITASGDTVPPFSAEITVPNSITLTQPNLTSSSLTVVQSKDFAVAWTGGGPAGDVTLEFNQRVGATMTVVQCSAPAGGGRAVVPASALGYLTATTELSSGVFGTAFGVHSSSVKTLTVQDWSIRLVAEPPDFVESNITVE